MEFNCYSSKQAEEMNNSPQPEPKNWAELTQDVLLVIFFKLSIFDLLLGAQYVCTPWRKIISNCPKLYKKIDMSHPWTHFGKRKFPDLHLSRIFLRSPWEILDKVEFDAGENMALQAIDRSHGQLVDFSISHFGSDQMLRRIVETSCPLKSLRLGYGHHPRVTRDAFLEAVGNMPLLEEVELCMCDFPADTVQMLGLACPGLKSFTLISEFPMYVFSSVEYIARYRNEAYGIAGSMPGLKSLRLFGNVISNSGLLAILDNCPLLEDIHLQQCLNVELKGELKDKFRRIRRSRFSTDMNVLYDFGEPTLDKHY